MGAVWGAVAPLLDQLMLPIEAVVENARFVEVRGVFVFLRVAEDER